MNWIVELHDEFEAEYLNMPEEVQNQIAIRANLLKVFGTQLGRPFVDKLKDSSFANMKELRLNIGNQIWRIAFAFDPRRKAILLVGGDKRGKDQRRFYKKLIKIADIRFQNHLDEMKKEEDNE